MAARSKTSVSSSPAAAGIVTFRDGTDFHVLTGGAEVRCGLRGRLRQGDRRVSSPVVVGDRVDLALLPGGRGLITGVRPRRGELSRPGPRGLTHVLAANLDLLVIVQAAREPAFRRRLVDRFLLTARRGGMDAMLVLNKCDLEQETVLRDWTVPFAEAGVPVVLTSAADGRGIESLREHLAGRVSALAGQSGVGKSSLLNALYPELRIRTGEVSAWSGKGRHTTTTSRLYSLPDGGFLADLPGIRQLALEEEDAESAEAAFPEIAAASEGCRFRDCAHLHEEPCAVKAAVRRGEIRPERYQDYLRLRGG